MLLFRTTGARLSAFSRLTAVAAPRAVLGCRRRAGSIIGFALTLLLMAGVLPVAVVPSLLTPRMLFAAPVPRILDADHDGIEDSLTRWRRGELTWADLRMLAEPRTDLLAEADKADLRVPRAVPAAGIWSAGGVRVIHLGAGGMLRSLVASRPALGHLHMVHDLALGGGVQAVAADATGLAMLLDRGIGGRLLLDRSGVPALDHSRFQVGVPQLEALPWRLGRDWSGSVAILDSGCDTAHGDLGDPSDDDIDGPPPGVGDAGDWSDASGGWSLSQGFKVVGWHDVTDDFPLAAGPWDYHYHGTALASVVAGSGTVDDRYRGVAAGGRLTVVKYYDFDGQWRMWAGDFLAACQWTLDHAELYRIRAALCAVNWDQDLGISEAMSDLVAAGIVPVVAMGNQGDDPAGPGFPARLGNVLTVGAVNGRGEVAAYSGRGTAEIPKPDLLAPGGGLLASGGRITAADNEPNDSYSPRVGTSLAAAHAAGAVYLLAEALKDAGLILPPDASTVTVLKAVLKATCAPVAAAEAADGNGVVDLGPQTGPDTVRGWGLMRIDGAVQALRFPLAPGQTGNDTLGAQDPIMARRLVLAPAGDYVLAAEPAAGLDISLEVLAPGLRTGDDQGHIVRRADTGGAGMAEVLDFSAGDQWMMAVVKVHSGQGTVALSLTSADPGGFPGAAFTLPGRLTGAPNLARLDGSGQWSLVFPSQVDVDPRARTLSVTDSQGLARPGWPVFLFPEPSSQGGLTQPLAWDLDGIPGDEIVAASRYGSLYIFSGDGNYQEIPLELNLPLGAPVGLQAADGLRLVAVADQDGVVRVWTGQGVLHAERDLGHGHPLALASGILNDHGEESLVVACRDGFVTALDASLEDLPGWPRFLAHILALPPVLLDRDGDRLHEVAIPVWAGPGDDLVLRVFGGDGSRAAADSTVLAPAAGGAWRALSPPALGGGYAAGGVTIDLVGLMDNGLSGDQARWYLGGTGIGPGGVPLGGVWPGFQVAATAPQSILTLDEALLPTPLVYGVAGAHEDRPVALVHLSWQDLLYGLSTMPGRTTAWMHPDPQGRPLDAHEATDIGGEDAPATSVLGAMLVPGPGSPARVLVQDEQVRVMTLTGAQLAAPYWLSARGDGRNSGAAALPGTPSAASSPGAAANRLEVFPNPGSGPVFLRLRGAPAASAALLEVYDLRGRRLLHRVLASDQGGWFWDGKRADGRTLAAGVYLAAIRQGTDRVTARITLTR